jgi:hypothetical protein
MFYVERAETFAASGFGAGEVEGIINHAAPVSEIRQSMG